MTSNIQGPGGGNPLTPKHEKLQKKKEQRFEHASARQLAKNILHGKIKDEAMETKSFGIRSIDTLRGKVKGQIKDIETKEEHRSIARKKVTHAFQRVKNKLLAGEFKNNMQMLEMAKVKLHKKKPIVVEPEKEKEPVEQPEKPEAQPPSEPPAKVVKVTKKKITRKQATINSINELAFTKDVDDKTVLKEHGTSLIKHTGKEGEYEVYYLTKGNKLEKRTLIVQESGHMSLQFGEKSPMSITSFALLLSTIARHNPGHLIGPPREEGGPNRKYKISK